MSAVITKQAPGKYQVECFVHLFDNCEQNSFAVTSIIEHLFEAIKKETPEIKNVYLRSDNAGCYHSGSLLLSLRRLLNEPKSRYCVALLRAEVLKRRMRSEDCANEGTYFTMG